MKDLTANLLRHNQRELLQKDISNLDANLAAVKDPKDAGVIRAKKRRVEKQLADQSPEPLTATEKDKLHSLSKKLREKITSNMPTEEVMRKNPAGAVDWHQKWEAANKKAIKIWKNIQIQLNPESSDRDLANIERYRPSGQTDRMRTDAQIPGLMTFGSVPEENWESVFPTPPNSALAQAQKRYDEQMAENDVNAALEELDKVAEDPEKGFGPSGRLTAEEYAAAEDRLRTARAALAKKRESDKQVRSIAEELPVAVSEEVSV